MADDTAPLPSGVRRRDGRRTVAVAVAAWLAVVVAAGALAWFAIGRAGDEVLDPAAQPVVPRGSVSTPAATATGSPTGTASPSPSTSAATGDPTGSATATGPATTSAPPRQPSRREVVSTTGGQVGVSCTGGRPALDFAQPATGWSVEQGGSDGGTRVRVEFETSEQRVRVEAVCAADGTPDVSVTTDDHGSGGGSDD